jgi:hypothetical protein
MAKACSSRKTQRSKKSKALDGGGAEQILEIELAINSRTPRGTKVARDWSAFIYVGLFSE